MTTCLNASVANDVAVVCNNCYTIVVDLVAATVGAVAVTPVGAVALLGSLLLPSLPSLLLNC